MKIGAALIFALLICQGDKNRDQDRAEDGCHGECYQTPKVRIWRDFLYNQIVRQSVQVYYNESGIFSWVMSEISSTNSGLNLEQSSIFYATFSCKIAQNPYVRCRDWVTYMKCSSGIAVVIAIFVAICLWSFYPFSQMTDSWALKMILLMINQSRIAVRNIQKKVHDQLLVCGIGDL